MTPPHLIIGAGPAGLTAGWELDRLGQRCRILEADPAYVGGIARTVEYRGNRFDMGGHRFYSKSPDINRVWREMLGEPFLEVRRRSRIYYGKRFLPYPLQLWPTLRQLGLGKALAIGLSFLRSQLSPRRPERSFEDWCINRFGYRLYDTFFKTYTEKVWGLECREISKDFAAQRIRGLSLWQAVVKALFPHRGDRGIKTLISAFQYPRLGPGQLWEAVRDHLLARGHAIELGQRVVRLTHRQGRVTAVETAAGSRYEADRFYSTMTLKGLVHGLDPPAPPPLWQAAARLRYRDFLTVALIVDQPVVFEDNWIYIHDPGVHVARIQNYKNWSPAMVADPAQTVLGLEYFVQQGDRLWEMPDSALIRLAAEELERIGLAKRHRCVDGAVVRIPEAYPVYDEGYQRHRDALKDWLNQTFSNLYPAGRGALHNYNSQDHSMMAARLSVRNLMEQTAFDVWAINTEEEYAEEGEVSRRLEARLVPRRIPVETADG